MEEKVIAKGTLKDSKLFCMLLPILGLLITICYDFQASYSSYRGEYNFGYGFGFGNGANYALYPMIIVLAVIGFIFYKRWSKVQITVTNKRVYGCDATAKRVDLPLDSITAVGTSLLTAARLHRLSLTQRKSSCWGCNSYIAPGREQSCPTPFCTLKGAAHRRAAPSLL